MLKVAQDVKPDHIYILGDYADFYSVSSHAKDPRVFQMLQDEVVDCLGALDQLDSLFPDAKKVFIQGNHEWRLERYLMNQAPALFGVTDSELILNLNDRANWKFIQYGPNQMVNVAGSYLVARHESLGSSAKATATKALCSLVYGHIHRIEESHMVGLDGTNHVCFSVGWLGDKRQDKIFDYVKSHHQWQLGFGLVSVNPKTRMFYHQKVHILENNNKVSCVVNGKHYEN
jgi:hypothetical protein